MLTCKLCWCSGFKVGEAFGLAGGRLDGKLMGIEEVDSGECHCGPMFHACRVGVCRGRLCAGGLRGAVACPAASSVAVALTCWVVGQPFRCAACNAGSLHSVPPHSLPSHPTPSPWLPILLAESAEGRRTAVVVHKARSTPAQYPRLPGVPGKKPL